MIEESKLKNNKDEEKDLKVENEKKSHFLYVFPTSHESQFKICSLDGANNNYFLWFVSRIRKLGKLLLITFVLIQIKRRAKNTGRNSPWPQLYIAAKIYGRNSMDATLLGRNSTWAEFYLAAILPGRKNLAAIVYGRNSTWPQFYGRNSTAATEYGRNTNVTQVVTCQHN